MNRGCSWCQHVSTLRRRESGLTRRGLARPIERKMNAAAEHNEHEKLAAPLINKRVEISGTDRKVISISISISIY